MVESIGSIERRMMGLAKEAAEIAVGAGVLAFQRAQVERQELLRTLGATSAHRGPVHERLSEARVITQHWAQLLSRSFEDGLDRLEDSLPEEGRRVLGAGRKEVRRIADGIQSAIGIA